MNLCMDFWYDSINFLFEVNIYFVLGRRAFSFREMIPTLFIPLIRFSVIIKFVESFYFSNLFTLDSSLIGYHLRCILLAALINKINFLENKFYCRIGTYYMNRIVYRVLNKKCSPSLNIELISTWFWLKGTISHFGWIFCVTITSCGININVDLNNALWFTIYFSAIF